MLGLMHDVSRFHHATGEPDWHWKYKPVVPSPERVALRRQLIAEETMETLAAMDKGDLVEIADGLADSIYVLIGTALEYGIPLHKIWDEVQRSNMAKAGPDGKVLRREDGKILKPLGWTPPDIKGILKAYGADLD